MAMRSLDLEAHNRSRELQLLAIARSSQDIVWWFNEWAWTYDPRLPEVAVVPMRLFPVQEDFLRWLEDRERAGEDGLVCKARDVGASWLCIGFLVHHWLFRQGFQGRVGSRKEKLVDELGNPDSLFEKARMLYRALPGWMLPEGFTPKEHDNFCKLVNPANGNGIHGEAGDEIGRGGRSSIYFVDEAAFLEHPQKVERALSGNTNCRIYVSTPNGPATAFAEKRRSGKVKEFDFDWRDDPRRNAWSVRNAAGQIVNRGAGGTPVPEQIPAGCKLHYDYEVYLDDLDPITRAQEYERDDTASVEGICIPAAWVCAAVNAGQKLGLRPSAEARAGLDVADGGDAESALVIRRGPIVGPIYGRRERGTTDTANWALDLSTEHKAKILNYDAPGVGAGIGGQFKARARLRPLGLIVNGVNTGASPTDRKWPNGKTSKEQFTNLKAELWWALRTRFEKTFEVVAQNAAHPLDELISIPDDSVLIRQLSSQRYAQSAETGKILILSKKSPEMRSVQSPDRADALVLTFAPARKPVTSAAGGERTAITSYKPR